MSIKDQIMSAGHSSLSANVICGVVATTTGTGSTISDASIVASDVSVISSTNSGGGAVIQQAAVGDEYELINISGSDVKIYPDFGSNFISLSTNASITLPSNFSVKCRKIYNQTWSYFFSSASSSASETGAIPTAGLILSYSAESLSSSLNDNDLVSSLQPDVGSAILTSSGAARPTFKTGVAPNGGDAIWFIGTSRLNTLSLTGLPIGAQPGTIVCVVSRVAPYPASADTYLHIVQYGRDSSSRARGLATSKVNRYFVSAEKDHNLFTYAGPTGSGLRVLGHTYDGDSLNVLVDGVEASSTVIALDTALDELAIGSKIGGAGEYGVFYFMHLLIYNRVLTRAEWRSIMDYARTEWGA